MEGFGLNARAVPTSRWSPARLFLLVTSIVHVPLGLIGFAYDRTFPVGADAAQSQGSALVFGILETNGWHTLGALLVGAVALFFTINPARARQAALAIGAPHVALTVSLMIWEPSTFWIASNAADQVIHSFSAIGGLVSGFATRKNPSAPV